MRIRVPLPSKRLDDYGIDERGGAGLADKRMTEDEVVSQIESGMTLGIGGWGSRRKPMSIIRAIARSPITDLTVVTYGGPDLGVLCALGKVRKAVYAFVSLDSIPLDPHFRAARQRGEIEDEPFDEGLFMLGLQAAAWRVPFLPCRSGLGTDVMTLNESVRTVRSPYGDPDVEYVAAPALELDAAICHLHRADERGNACFLNADLYFDDLFLRAAKRNRFISVENVVRTEDLVAVAGTEQRCRISRVWVDGVVERAGAAHFTDCAPDYPRDEPFQKEYASAAASPEAFAEFKANWLDLDEVEYQSKRGRR